MTSHSSLSVSVDYASSLIIKVTSTIGIIAKY